jgi:hypothetical protein
MANLTKVFLAAALLLSLIACGAKEEPTGVIPQGHLDAMDKAKDVENVLQDAQKQQLEDIDKPG